MPATKEQFDQAAKESKQLTSKPESFDLLELYGLFKVANSEDFSAAAKPGMLDLKGKAKYSAWQKNVDAGMTAEEAMEKYVAKVAALKESCGFDPNKEPETVG